VRKTVTASPATFRSISAGPVGWVVECRRLVRRHVGGAGRPRPGGAGVPHGRWGGAPRDLRLPGVRTGPARARLVGAGFLDGPKARVLLSLALASGADVADVFRGSTPRRAPDRSTRSVLGRADTPKSASVAAMRPGTPGPGVAGADGRAMLESPIVPR
jgi:hypothetical protein